MNEQRGFIENTTGVRRHSGKLALQTAIIHLCCSVACIIIGVFSLAIIKSKTMENVYGLPLWIGLLVSTLELHHDAYSTFGFVLRY